MKRTRVDEIFLEAYDCRVSIIRDIVAIKSGADQGAAIDDILANMDKIIELLGENQTKKYFLIFKSLATAYKHLVQWENAVKNAEENASRFHDAYKYHVKEGLKQVKELGEAKEVSTIIHSMDKIELTDDIGKALDGLFSLPLPLPIHWKEDPMMDVNYYFH